MKVATTIQISAEEDKLIVSLKKALHLASKKAVIMEGVRSLEKTRLEKERIRRLQADSKRVQPDSRRINQEWAPHAAAVKPT